MKWNVFDSEDKLIGEVHSTYPGYVAYHVNYHADGREKLGRDAAGPVQHTLGLAILQVKGDEYDWVRWEPVS